MFRTPHDSARGRLRSTPDTVGTTGPVVPRRVFASFRLVIARASRHRLAQAIVVFAIAFLYRFNALGGALGGFDGDHFIYYLGARAVAHGERPLRDFADAGLQGAWPALTYELPALAQGLGGETLLSEAVLVVGAIALALAILFMTAAELAGTLNAIVVVCATLFASTKLYGYSKLLVFAIAAALFVRYARKPSSSRAAQLAVLSVVAFLFRHDLLVYLTPSAAVLIVALESKSWRVAGNRLLMYGAVIAVLLAGPLYSIHRYGGVRSYVETNIELSTRESQRTNLRWPQFASTGGGVAAFFDHEQNAVAWLYYLSLAIPGLALFSLFGSPHAPGLDARQTRALIVSLAVLAALLDRFFLRGNLAGRLGDLGAPIAILAAWLPARFRAAPLSTRALVWAITTPVLVATALALSTTGDVWHELDTTGFRDSFKKIGRRVVAVTTELSALPPPADAPLDPEPNAAEYVRLCTNPDDRVLVIADAPEILGMGRRSFAAGQRTFRPGFYTLQGDQRLMRERLRVESVPFVLTDKEDTYSENFAPEFPLIHGHVTRSYEVVGELPALAGDPVRVLAQRGHSVVTQYRSTGLPCFRSGPGSIARSAFAQGNR